MYKIKKWAEANFKRSGIERKTKLNTIGWNSLFELTSDSVFKGLEKLQLSIT